MPNELPPVFRHTFRVPKDAIDENDHVNNVAYVQWMQDVATLHSDAVGLTRAAYEENGTAWVVRTHHVDYLSPAFEGEEIEAVTWISNLKKVTSLRKYKFFRKSDQTLLARAETNWVYINLETTKPQALDKLVIKAFTPVAETDEP